MKKLFTVFLAVLSINAEAQEDTLFPNISASWYIGTWQLQTNGDPPQYGGYECFFVDDSIQYNGHEWGWIFGAPDGYIRQDSGKIIVQFPWGGTIMYGPQHFWTPDTSEFVLYDFNLQIGDTAYVIDGWPGNSIIVLDTGTTNLLGQNRKTLYLSENERWVYGMGSDKGFLYPVLSHFEIGINYVCFNGSFMDSLGNDYQLQYEESPGDCSLSIEDIKASIEPTIKTRCGLDKLWITLQQPETVKIFSADGKFVHGIKLPSGESVFEFDFLERGAYIIRIGANYAEKFIKQ